MSGLLVQFRPTGKCVRCGVVFTLFVAGVLIWPTSIRPRFCVDCEFSALSTKAPKLAAARRNTNRYSASFSSATGLRALGKRSLLVATDAVSAQSSQYAGSRTEHV